MVTVSVNAYQDADLLEGCLASIREELPRARIQVVDGAYRSWPGWEAAPNSTDGTPDVCNAYGAEYWPDGPFDREHDKHWGRIARALDDERLLFMDADERLLAFADPPIGDDEACRVRIFNALWYGPRVNYYPRYFYPGQMDDIPRVDRYSFDCGVAHTDFITIVHRADLRSDAYRDAKECRYTNEGRTADWYAEHREEVASPAYTDFDTCPECGEASVTRSRVCGWGPSPQVKVWGREPAQYTHVEACTARDRCYAAIVDYELDGWEYVPTRVREGFESDLERVRVELMDAGWALAKTVPQDVFGQYVHNAEWWLERVGLLPA